MPADLDPFVHLLPWIRSQFPQIELLRDGRRRIYLDNAAGTLMPRTVADAMADAALWANPQPGRGWPPSPETERLHRETRELLAAFLNAAPHDPIYFAESTTSWLYRLREALEPGWDHSHNLVVTDCDHFANISPWEWRARWEVRRARMLADGGLDLDHLSSLLDAGTRVVALTLAGNGLGTILPVEEAVTRVRERAPGAIIVVDAVHGAPHLPIDVQRLGADALVFSAYKLFGPNCGVLWLREELAGAVDPYRVEPHRDAETLPEWGTLNNGTAAGIRAALEYLRRLGERLEPQWVGKLAEYPRDRRLLKIAMTAARDYERELSRRVLGRLAEAKGKAETLQLFGITDPERASERVPTFAFAIEGREPDWIEHHLWERWGLQVAASNHYAASVTRGLGRRWVGRASFAHYNTIEEADLLAQVLAAGGEPS